MVPASATRGCRQSISAWNLAGSVAYSAYLAVSTRPETMANRTLFRFSYRHCDAQTKRPRCGPISRRPSVPGDLLVLSDEGVLNRWRTPFTACHSADKRAVDAKTTSDSAVHPADSLNQCVELLELYFGRFFLFFHFSP